MSDAGGNRTEKPTPKRIDDARKEGQVAKSNDLNSAIILMTSTLLMVFVGPYTYNLLFGMVHEAFTTMLLQSRTTEGFVRIITSTVESIAWLLIPFFVGILAMAVLGNLVQIKPMVSPKAIQPKLDKLNPLQGFKRMWSTRSIVEVGKSIIKMIVIGGCAVGIIMANEEKLMGLSHYELQTGVGTILEVVGAIAGTACCIFLVMGLADFFYQKYELEKQLRMTKQQVKDERKNMEGDPQIKRKIREVGIQMTRKRQLSAVPTADVVITNPTHFSVAVKYDPDVSPAPMVVAKGQDHFAFKIREVANEHGVPIIENKPVARALYAVCEVDSMIPPELFVAVAQVLAVVFSKKKGRNRRFRRT